MIWLRAVTPLSLWTHRSRSFAIWHYAFTRSLSTRTSRKAWWSGNMPSHILLFPTQGLRSLMVRRHAITQRSGIMPSHALQLPTHRSRSLAIRHHAITRLDSGAKVARLNGPASCLRVSPSLPLKTTLGRSSPHAPAPSSFRLLSIKSKSLAVWHPCQPTYFVHTSSTHRSSL